MKAKAIFDAYRKAEADIIAMKRQLEVYREFAQLKGQGSQANTGQRLPKASSRVEYYLVKIIELEAELGDLQVQHDDACVALFKLIQCLNIDYQMVLTMHYIENESFRAIASQLDCSERRVYDLHQRALALLDRFRFPGRSA